MSSAAKRRSGKSSKSATANSAKAVENDNIQPQKKSTRQLLGVGVVLVLAVALGGRALLTHFTSAGALSQTRLVNNENELVAALGEAGDGDTIAIGADIPISRDIMLTPFKSLNFSSAAGNHCPNQICTLTRAAGYTGDILTLQSYTNLTMQNLTLDGGGFSANGSLIAAEYQGNVLHLSQGSTLTNNSTSGDGGAIRNVSTIQISSGATISQTAAAIDGGAIETIGTVQMSGGQIVGCRAGGNGGALRVDGAVQLSGNALISSNWAGMSGGGIYLNGKLSMEISTISDNVAAGTSSVHSGEVGGSGGGLWVSEASLQKMSIAVGARWLRNSATSWTAAQPRPDDLAFYNQNVRTSSWTIQPGTSSPFAYGLNNYDISYQGSTPLPDPTPLPGVPISPFPRPTPTPQPDPDDGGQTDNSGGQVSAPNTGV
ncbi:MAG: hypothetical protein LBM73_00595 [Candidatus Nomurabacteria bacterium]|nr:hypothetical protein [Candidatus Nomurabacteria bacterium]